MGTIGEAIEMAENELPEAVVEEARVAALVALARHGPSHDVQAFLVRGDDRGTFPPGALEVMVRAALTAAGVTEMRASVEWLASLIRKRDRVHPSNRRDDLPMQIKLTFGDLEAIIAALALPPVEPADGGEARELLDWLGEHHNAELTFCHGSEDDDLPRGWIVETVNGGVNDREWVCVGHGADPLAAIANFRLHLTGQEPTPEPLPARLEERAREILAIEFEAAGRPGSAARIRNASYATAPDEQIYLAAIRKALPPVEPADGGEARLWLIEFPEAGDSYRGGKRVGPAYSVRYYGGTGHRTRTEDANLAVRFSRKEDAEHLIVILGLERALASEHCWLATPEPLPARLEERAREILANVPHKADCPERNSTGYCKCHTYRALSAIRKALSSSVVAMDPADDQ